MNGEQIFLCPVFGNIEAQVMRICMLIIGLKGLNDWYCLLTGMKPLMYSEREATARGLGWKRAGTRISYCKTSSYKSLLLHRENVYYTLTFHIVSYVNFDVFICSSRIASTLSVNALLPPIFVQKSRGLYSIIVKTLLQ